MKPTEEMYAAGSRQGAGRGPGARSMKTLAVDPGKEGLALCLLQDNVFADCALFRLPKKPLTCIGEWQWLVRDWVGHHDVDLCIVEEMVYYPQAGSAKSSSEIAAILQLQYIGGIVAGWSGADEVRTVPARGWKGQLKKEICHERLLKTLDSAEKDAFERCCGFYPKGLQHNLLDSLGIAKHSCGRFRV